MFAKRNFHDIFVTLNLLLENIMKHVVLVKYSHKNGSCFILSNYMFRMLPMMGIWPLRLTIMILPERWYSRGGNITSIVTQAYFFSLTLTTGASLREQSSGKQVLLICFLFVTSLEKRACTFSCSIYPNLYTNCVGRA